MADKKIKIKSRRWWWNDDPPPPPSFDRELRLALISPALEWSRDHTMMAMLETTVSSQFTSQLLQSHEMCSLNWDLEWTPPTNSLLKSALLRQERVLPLCVRTCSAYTNCFVQNDFFNAECTPLNLTNWNAGPWASTVRCIVYCVLLNTEYHS